MFKVKVALEFSAAHFLRGYRGKCEELHGHNWKVEVAVVKKNLDKIGMVVDFQEVKSQLKVVLDKLDHRHLNEIAFFKKVNPTSEEIAKYIYENIKRKISGVESVTVWESDRCSATYFR